MKHITYLLLAFASLLMTACDAHQDFPDTTIKPCHILCTDGKVVPYSQYEAENKQAIAVVFNTHKGENMEGTGYAVYLWDIEPVAFSDSLGCAQGTSADLMAHDGNLNTYKMYEGKEVGSPLANSVFAIWAYGQSAYIPSVAQMRLLYAAKDIVNPYIKKCGGDPYPDYPDECWYWTSTEVQNQDLVKAWLYSLSSGALQETPKNASHKARAIISLNQ